MNAEQVLEATQVLVRRVKGLSAPEYRVYLDAYRGAWVTCAIGETHAGVMLRAICAGLAAVDSLRCPNTQRLESTQGEAP